MTAAAPLRAGALLVALAAAGWLGSRMLSGRTGAAAPAKAPPPPTAAAFDSATVTLRGELTSAAGAELRRVAGESPAVLVLLDTADIRVCEDLGRQLRELHARSGPARPLVVVADSAALPRLRNFTRREHLRPAGFVALAAGSVLAGGARAPTPAVLLTRAGSLAVVGVGHPRRFPNVRVRSFADELSAHLPAPAGSPPPP